MFGRTINFGNYGPNHGLIVIDMQSRFLDNPFPDMREHVKKLIRKIGAHIEECLSLGGEVVFIEFDGPGSRTIPHLKNAALRGRQKNFPNNHGTSHTILKDDNSVLSEYRDNLKYLKTNKDFFLQRIGRMYTLSGVNAYFCVSECATDLEKIGCKIKIDVGLTLNTSRGKPDQKIGRLNAPGRIIHAPSIYPSIFPVLRGGSFLEYL